MYWYKTLFLSGFFLIWFGSIVATFIIAALKNISILGYGFLSFFTGPLALVLVLLTPSRRDRVDAAENPNSAGEVQKELDSIKRAFGLLQLRIKDLESKLGMLSQKAPAAEAAPIPKKEPIQVAKPVPPRVETPKPKKKPGESFELIFGKYWLNRIGIILFVLGVAFFINYTFKDQSPHVKIIIAYLASIATFIWGSFLEKKERYRRIAWGILGGAWALLYLTTFAMHYIEVTRIIESTTVALTLLSLVSVAAIIYSLRYKSWAVTAITYLLAFITVGLGGMDYSTIVYCALLVGSIAFISYRLAWHRFLLFGILGAYLTQGFWLIPKIKSAFMVSPAFTIPIYYFQISYGMLTITWLLFSAALFMLKADNRERVRSIVTGTLANCGFYVIMGLHQLYRVRAHLELTWDIRVWFLLVLSGIYFLASYMYKHRAKARLIVMNICIAFTLLAMTAVIKLPRSSVAFFWILEMGLIFTLGLYYKEVVYRILASVMGGIILFRLFIVDFFIKKHYTLLGVDFNHNLLIFLFGAACFYIMGALTKKKKLAGALSPEGAGFYNTFIVLGALLFTFARFPRFSTGFFWTIEMALFFGLGIYYKELVYRILAGARGLLVFFWIFSVDFATDRYYTVLGLDINHNILIFAFVALVFFAMGALAKRKEIAKNLRQAEIGFSNSYIVVGTVLIMALLGKEIKSKWLSLGWAAQGAGLLGVGYFLKQKVYRICALSIFSLACLRVIFVDMAGINTIYKILAFIVLGAVLVGASLIYSKFISKEG